MCEEHLGQCTMLRLEAFAQVTQPLVCLRILFSKL